MTFPLPVSHSLWNPLQLGFIHSGTFLIKGNNSFHITESKIKLHTLVFLGLSAAVGHVGHALLEVLPTWLPTSPRSLLMIPHLPSC